MIEKKNEWSQLVHKLAEELRFVIAQDDFIDGEISKSEQYIRELVLGDELTMIRDALNHIYETSFDQPHILVGVLTIVSSLPYDTFAPDAQTIAIGALSHKDLEVRDKAIQCFERWNSKKGLDYLRRFKFEPAWLQRYVDRVIYYIERDGLD